jgi:glutamate-1-semialdehyde aminotransferase
VRATATRTGAVLVFDEVTSGWRMNTGGVHMTYGVEPDMATFAKAMANGYAMAAIIGRRPVMEAAQKTFISSTFWTERIGPVAALATIRKHRRERVFCHVVEMGRKVQAGWLEAARRAGLDIEIYGLPPIASFKFHYDNGLALATLFTQEMLRRGFLATTQFVSTFAHQAAHVDSYLAAAEEVFHLLAKAQAESRVEASLDGPVRHAGFQRLN